MNVVMLTGNLGADGELKVLPSGEAVIELRLATSKTWKDKVSGEKKEATQWHRAKLFGKRAEGLAPYLLKGKKIAVTGEIRYSEYEKDGVRKYATDIIVNDIELLSSKEKNEFED